MVSEFLNRDEGPLVQVADIKTFADAEPNPTKDVGTGVYDYVVGIYTPAQELIAMGGKVRTSTRLTW